MTDPAAMEGMMGMMKGNMAMMVPQTLIMGWINAFFAGFVVCELCDLLCSAKGLDVSIPLVTPALLLYFGTVLC